MTNPYQSTDFQEVAYSPPKKISPLSRALQLPYPSLFKLVLVFVFGILLGYILFSL